MLFLERGMDHFPSLVILRWSATTKIFLSGLLFAVVLCFVRGKRPIVQVFASQM
jgi:hypothetical protein